MEKRGMSDLIATVLIILLTLTAAAIIAAAVISFTKKNLENSKVDCLTANDKITIVSEDSCYNNADMKTNVSVRFGNINATKIYLVLDVGEETNVYEKTLDRISAGMVRRYTFDTNSTKVDVGFIINNKKCDISDSMELQRC